MVDSVEQAVSYVRDNDTQFRKDVASWCAIPSVSLEAAPNAQVQSAAEWGAERLKKAGFTNIALLPTAGHPAVYGESLTAGPGKPTVLAYGHYDVQPADDRTNWQSPPFEPSVRAEHLYARGASDMKGQVVAVIAAAEAYLKTSRALPVNLKLIIEGEEEIASRNFGEMLQRERERLACDYCLNTDAGMLSPSLPTIKYGLRGGVLARLTVSGPRTELHSGHFGGTIGNPIHALCSLVAGLHDDGGKVTLPGFYDRVLEITDSERRQLALLPTDEGHFLRVTGVPALFGEPGFTPNERTCARPTVEVTKIEIPGAGGVAAIPPQASAFLLMRLVPAQDPEECYQSLLEYLESRTEPAVRVEATYIDGGPATLVDRTHPGIRAMHRALEASWGVAPLYTREGGSIIAVSLLEEHLGAVSVLTGFGLPDDNIHGVNERLHLPTWRKGIEALIRFFHEAGISYP